MHPSFGIEFVCASAQWEDIMRGPPQWAVIAHTHKILHYRSIFGPKDMRSWDGAQEPETNTTIRVDAKSFAEVQSAAA